MKYFFYALICLGLLASCKSNKKASEAKDTTNKSASIGSSNPLADEFKPIIQGVWLKKDYADKIIQTKSPLAAKDLAFGLTDMYIETDSIKNDSVVVVTGWANQDGSDLVLKFKQGKKPNTISFSGYDLGYKISRNDTTLILYSSDNDKNMNSTTEYKKIANKESFYDEGVDYFIGKSIVSGDYLMTTPSHIQKKVTFNNKGEVTNLSGFKTFVILNDLVGEPENYIDEIEFDISSRHPQYYGIKIDRDTLNLYNLSRSANSVKSTLGDIVYKLVKQK